MLETFMKSFVFLRGNELLVRFCVVKWFSVNLKMTGMNARQPGAGASVGADGLDAT